jgi:hypothetical protein
MNREQEVVKAEGKEFNFCILYSLFLVYSNGVQTGNKSH